MLDTRRSQAVFSGAVSRLHRREAALAAAALFVVLAFTLLFLTRAAEQTRDSLVYAYAAKTGSELFHPHHLLYNPAVRLTFLVLRQLCPGCDAVLAGQVHNILWSLAGLLAFFFLARKFMNPLPAGLSTLLLLAGRGWWELSTQTTMYAPSAALLCILAAVLLAGGGFPPRRVLALGGLLGLAVLFLQSNVLFLLPVGVFLLASRGRDGWKPWIAVALIAGVLALASYSLAYLSQAGDRSLAGFLRFCLSYTQEICLGGQCKASPQDWGSFSNLSPTGLGQLLDSLVWNLLALPDWLALPGRALALLAGVGLGLWHLVRLLQKTTQAPLRAFLLAWCLVYLGFYGWWLPSYQHPLLAVLAPGLLLALLAGKDLASLLGRRKFLPAASGLAAPAGLAALAGLVLLLGGRNFQARVLPLHRSAGDSYAEAAALAALAPGNCPILTSYRTWNHLRYYFDRRNAIQVKTPLSFFASNTPLPRQYTLEDSPCVFVAGHLLFPGAQDEGGSALGQEPGAYLSHLAWLLDFESGPGGTLSTRAFEGVPVQEGGIYFRILDSRQTYAGEQELFERLDAELQDPARPFQTWFASGGSG